MSVVRSDRQTIWLMGGLGNQLFQVQFGFWLQQNFNRKIEYNLALTQKNYVTTLMGWSIHEFVLQDILDLDNNLFSCWLNPVTIFCSKTVLCKNHAFFQGLDDVSASNCRNLFGYYQNKRLSEEMFGSCFMKLREDPSVRFDLAMHLRGGDIKNSKAAIEYYDHALDACGSSVIHVVTDSKELLRLMVRNHSRHKFVDVSAGTLSDFKTLASSTKVIVAPSTFSWWAARLGLAKDFILPKGIHERLGNPKVGPYSYKII